MQVSEIMTRIFNTIPAEATILQASIQLSSHNVGFLPVVEVTGEVNTQTHDAIVEEIGFKPLENAEVLVGVVTDRDIAVRGVAVGKDPNTTPVSEIMTPHVATCYEHNEISDAVVVMEQRKVRRLLALDREGNPVGVISLDDIAVPDPCLSGETLQAMTK